MGGETVVVTGANGFVASWLVKLLLERGYHVHGTVRDPDDIGKSGHLLQLPGAKERLKLFKAELLDENSFDEALEGATGVFHTASLSQIKDVPDIERDLLLPAVNGTLSVLSAAVRAKTVRRVVLTSSNAAISCREDVARPKTPNVVVDESWWADEEWCKKSKLWYPLSKIMAEKAAWDFVKDKNFDMVVINPTLVLGPLMQKKLTSSCEVLLDFITDNSMTWNMNRTLGMVHVKDVATAHVLAYEHPAAEGRYILSEKGVHGVRFANFVKECCPDDVKLAEKVEPRQVTEVVFNGEKIKKLGLEYIPAEDAVRDTVASLKEHGFYKP